MEAPLPLAFPRLVAGALLAFGLAGAPAGAHEAGQHADGTFVTFTGDNDFFAGYDHHYTNGFQLAISADRVPLPQFVRALPPLRTGTDPHLTFSVGQRLYTPSDKTRSSPDPLDRPYGGWLYALAEVRVRNGAAVDSVQASLGVIGPAALGRQTQNFYHGLLGAEKGRGWDAQIENEPALLVGYERAWPGIATTQVGSFTADVTPRIGATLGNVYTYANTGVVLRFGRNLPDDFPVTSIGLGPPRDGYRPTGTQFGWYAWLGTEARLVGWNTFLDGNLFRDSPSVDRKPFGHDVQIGLAAVWGTARVGFTFVRRSKEFETQSGDDKFGQITISFGV